MGVNEGSTPALAAPCTSPHYRRCSATCTVRKGTAAAAAWDILKEPSATRELSMGEFFKREVFRPFATLIVPGVITVFPYATQLLYTYPDIQTFAHANVGASVVIGVIFALAVGLILEDVGAKIEVLWDSILDKQKANVRKADEHTDIWRRYLALTFKDEPVGQNYLRTIVIRLKFELGMVVAIPFSWLGFLWLHQTIELWTNRSFIIASLLAAGTLLYLIYESYESASTLGKTRKLLVDRYELR